MKVVMMVDTMAALTVALMVAATEGWRAVEMVAV